MDLAEQLSTLCRSCGLCCDGSLFGRARLAPDEVDDARRIKLRVVPNGASFAQPCTAWKPGVGCGVYLERPRTCRKFSCKLFERHRTEGGPLAPRLQAVARVRELARQMERGAREGSPVHEELVRRVEEDFARAD